jgi:Site-specific recombinases, DNA invertase Pin homologs
MAQFIADQKHRPVILVEKTDRLYRNYEDALLIQHLGIDIHCVKEGRVVGKDSRSQDILVHDINVAIARNYSNNLKEEVRKGMLGRAEAGWYPGRAPIGYRSNRIARTIEVDPKTKDVVLRIFELYATGACSLAALRKQIRVEYGKTIKKLPCGHS